MGVCGAGVWLWGPACARASAVGTAQWTQGAFPAGFFLAPGTCAFSHRTPGSWLSRNTCPRPLPFSTPPLPSSSAPRSPAILRRSAQSDPLPTAVVNTCTKRCKSGRQEGRGAQSGSGIQRGPLRSGCDPRLNTGVRTCMSIFFY